MIIDIHAHYTQASAKLDAYRGRQVFAEQAGKGSLSMSDDETIASLQGNSRQMIRRIRRPGGPMTIGCRW
jgi:hypothetical protein